MPVVGGAQGVSTDRDVTFLGRGGSDTTAVALAAALGADACELYTDVPGVFTADPRLVPDARRLATVSFDEMLEMTATGCPKPAMRSVEFARNWGVPLHVRSSFTWEPGTWVDEEDPSMEQAIISAVTHDTSEAKVTVTGVPDQPGIAARLFRALADRRRQRRHDRAERLAPRHHRHLLHRPQRRPRHGARGVAAPSPPRSAATDVSADADIAKVSLIGAGMKTNPGVARHHVRDAGRQGINIEMISTSAIRITCVVREAQVEQAVQALHHAFGLETGRPWGRPARP